MSETSVIKLFLFIDTEECLRHPGGENYTGHMNVTFFGKTCQLWSSQIPHGHAFGRLENESNFCRNPDGESKPWCYTTDPDKRYEFCDIPLCTLLSCNSTSCGMYAISPGKYIYSVKTVSIKYFELN